MRDALRGTRVLVTGATGFLGSHLARRLTADGAEVHLAVRAGSSPARIADLLPQVTRWTCDLREADSIGECVSRVRPQAVFHLAGVTSGRRQIATAGFDIASESYDVNVTGTLRLLMAVGRHAPQARIIRTGGLEEYGNGPLPYREDQRESPISIYSATQVAATHIGHTLARQSGLSMTTLRPALIYGPDQPTNFFIPALILACLRGEPFDMTAGRQTRDLIYVDDVIEALVASASAPAVADRIINVGSGREYRICDVAALVLQLSGSATELRIGSLTSSGADLERLVCDPSLALELLDWQPRTSLEDGLRHSLAAYRRAACRNATARTA